MSTVPQTLKTSPPTMPEKSPRGKEQLRRDRIVAAVVLLVLAVLFGLMVWLANLSGAPSGMEYDYWMMP